MPRRTASHVTWGTPAKAGAGRGAVSQWIAILDEVRENQAEHPDEFALISVQKSPTLASSIKSGKFRGIEPGEFDATTRSAVDDEGNRVFEIWVRYVGG